MMKSRSVIKRQWVQAGYDLDELDFSKVECVAGCHRCVNYNLRCKSCTQNIAIDSNRDIYEDFYTERGERINK